MLAKLVTYTLLGIEARTVAVEVDISAGAMPRTLMVGLAEASVRESVHRIERALVNSGYAKPADRIVINLSPADLPKDAASFDLPIAVGLLVGSGQVVSEHLESHALIGELALDGRLRPVRGVLSMALTARNEGRAGIVVPIANAREAAVVDGLRVIAVDSLTEAIGFLSGRLALDPVEFHWEGAREQFGQYSVDYADVRGQELAKRAVTVAAAGGHHLLMIGSPGTGKTLLAQRLGSILPPLDQDESLETTRIYSAVGRLPAERPLLLVRPFRAPHHTISEAGLVGGGSVPAPGEISLAHHGVLFLDELPEFQRKTLEVMRQPLEDRQVTISRALGSHTFPANIMLVAAMNPCPCGYRGDPRRTCHCSPPQIERYMARISGPLMDRIDIHVEVPPVPFRELSSELSGTDSGVMRNSVEEARQIQRERIGDHRRCLNAGLSPPQIRQHCRLEKSAEHLLRRAMDEMGLSARAHDKILRIGRTIADLAGSGTIEVQHLSEAINYRTLDREGWNRVPA